MSSLAVSTLAVMLGKSTVGYLTHYQDGKNIFVFDNEYINEGIDRPTLSLFFSDLENELVTRKRLSKTHCTMHSLPAYFSNLLPEGSLKEYIINSTKIHPNDEFSLLKILGSDLSGNIRVQAIEPLHEQQLSKDHPPEIIPIEDEDDEIRFSLAGIQMKFSMRHQDNRFTISRPGNWGDYIVKTPSTIHPQLPENEYSMMRLAEAAGVDIPEIKLVNIAELDHLPPINLPNEQYAFAIKRFDRDGNNRIHIEDFAQVLGLRSRHKYRSTNYDTLARVLQSQSLQPIKDIQQFITRITVNILLGNTDAHIKNWSLIYRDGVNPSLSPAYDILSSLTYISDRNNALNFGGMKYFYDLNQETVNRFIKNIRLSSDIVNETITKTRQAAVAQWPGLMEELPLTRKVKSSLIDHARKLQEPFRLVL